MPGSVIQSEYKVALQAPTLDTSDFILLSVGYMEKIAGKPGQNPKLERQLMEIRRLYTMMNFEDATKQILAVCQEHAKIMSPEIVGMMHEKVKTLKDNPAENDSRRFYETRLAAALNKDLDKSGDYKSVDKLLTVMKDFNIEMIMRWRAPSRTLPKKVTNLEEANHVLMQVLFLNDNIEQALKDASENYKKKNRSDKRQAFGYDPKIGQITPESKNPGIMRGLSPNFYDLLLEKTENSRVPDKYLFDTQAGYSKEHKGVPFTGSVSGTTFTVMALLDAYVQKYGKKGEPNPELQAEVNGILRSFVALYVNTGFHSIGEMMDVINEPHIQKLFQAYNIKPEFTVPEEAMVAAFKDAQQYAKKQSQQKAMHDELKSKVPQAPEYDIQDVAKNPAANVTEQRELKRELERAETVDDLIKVLKEHKRNKGIMLSAKGEIIPIEQQLDAIERLRNNMPYDQVKVTSNYGNLEAKVKRLIEAQKRAKVQTKVTKPQEKKVETPVIKQQEKQEPSKEEKHQVLNNIHQLLSEYDAKASRRISEDGMSVTINSCIESEDLFKTLDRLNIKHDRNKYQPVITIDFNQYKELGPKLVEELAKRGKSQTELDNKIEAANTVKDIIDVIKTHQEYMYSAKGVIISKENQLKAIEKLRNGEPYDSETGKVTSNYGNLEAKVKRLIEEEKQAKEKLQIPQPPSPETTPTKHVYDPEAKPKKSILKKPVQVRDPAKQIKRVAFGEGVKEGVEPKRPTKVGIYGPEGDQNRPKEGRRAVDPSVAKLENPEAEYAKDVRYKEEKGPQVKISKEETLEKPPVPINIADAIHFIKEAYWGSRVDTQKMYKERVPAFIQQLQAIQNSNKSAQAKEAEAYQLLLKVGETDDYSIRIHYAVNYLISVRDKEELKNQPKVEEPVFKQQPPEDQKPKVKETDPIKLAMQQINDTMTWAIIPADKRTQWLYPLLDQLKELDKKPYPPEVKRTMLQKLVSETYISAAQDEGGYNAQRVAEDILKEVLNVPRPNVPRPNAPRPNVPQSNVSPKPQPKQQQSAKTNDPRLIKIIDFDEKSLNKRYNEIRQGKGTKGWVKLQVKNVGKAMSDVGRRREKQIAEMALVFDYLKKNPSSENSFKAWSYLAEMTKDIQKENNKFESALLIMCNKMMNDIDPSKSFMTKGVGQIEKAAKDCKAAVSKDVRVKEPEKSRKKRKN